MRFHQILCPIDFSPSSRRALRTAARLAKRDHAGLVILHVGYAGDPGLGDYQFSTEILANVVTDERRHLDDALIEMKQLGVDHVSAELLRGHPWPQISERLDGDPTLDLVVIGARGRTGASRFLFGSVAEKVIRHAPCPVLVTGEGIEALPFRRILCPVDFSAGSQHALDLIPKAIDPSSEVTLLHVLDAPPSYAKEPSLRTFEDDLDREAASQLTKAADALRPNVTASVGTRVVVGHPSEEILRVLEASPPFDLVIMGSHGRTGLKRVLLGSVAERIAHHAPCPVLIARPADPEPRTS